MQAQIKEVTTTTTTTLKPTQDCIQHFTHPQCTTTGEIDGDEGHSSIVPKCNVKTPICHMVCTSAAVENSS